MTKYPIKMLKDKDGTLFIPLTNSDSVQTSTGDTLENLISSKADESELSHYVTLDTQQTITGAKTFNSTLTMSNVNNAKYTTSTTTNISPNATALSNPPWNKDFWHDHFAFLRYHTIQSQETTTDGTTWTTVTRSINDLFSQKESNAITILNASELGYRLVLKNTTFAYSGLSWFEIGVTYSNPFSNFNILIEFSTDNSTWSTCHNSTITGNSQPFFLKNNTSFTGDGYLRFTFTKTTNTTTGIVRLSCIKGFCTRKGDQGLGSEFEYPYEWDYNANILPLSNNNKNLGTSEKKWANVYATNFNGNASTASLLKCVDSGSSTDASTWTNYTSDNKTVVWGQKFIKSAYSSDSGDISLSIEKVNNSTSRLNMSLDGKVVASGGFQGNLDGTASRATGDKNGDDITTTYYKASNPNGYTSNTGTITGITMNGASKGTSGVVDLGTVSTTDTKNTAGSTDTSSKIFLIGATSQAANPQTYSDNEVYATSGVLTTKSVQVGGAAATMQYNSTDKCIEFVFA